MESQTKICQSCKKDFTIEPDDFDFYKKMKVPPPTWCPECRMIRRMLWRNERKLFRRKDARTGKDLLALYPEESGWPVYHESDWWNLDLWDPLSYGQDFNPQKSFLVQFFELCKKVPKPHSDAVNMVNSEYSANAADMKNCYLVFASEYDEDCAYGQRVMESKDCLDGLEMVKCTNCYENIHTEDCYNLFYAQNCKNCSLSYFLFDCE